MGGIGSGRYTEYNTKEEAKEANREAAKRNNKKRLERALLVYGGQCSCCGETEQKFLEIDHINQDGGKFRKQHGISGGGSFINWLEKNGWPDAKELGIQLLCANCHLAKDYRGGCPHKGEYVKPAVGRPRLS